MMTGPNLWPLGQPVFKRILEEYFIEVRKLALLIFRLVAESLELDFEAAFGKFCKNEASAVRLLHYPPQEVLESEEQLGTGM